MCMSKIEKPPGQNIHIALAAMDARDEPDNRSKCGPIHCPCIMVLFLVPFSVCCIAADLSSSAVMYMFARP